MFERHIAIDWSGAGRDDARNGGLAVAVSDGEESSIVAPPRHKRWSRREVEAFLTTQLGRSAPRTLVAIDAALSFPDGFQQAVFGVSSWLEMVAALSALGGEHATARSLARAINEHAGSSGPFRFNESRNDGSFYVAHEMAYFRAIEMIVPQAISPFYLGSGAAVGFHAITCLQSLYRLTSLRDRGEIQFSVWPHEGLECPTDGHVIVECYPSMYPHVAADGLSDHARDALRAVAWVDREARAGRLAEHLQVREPVVGLRKGRSWQEQMRFEGWVLGA